MQSQIQLTGFGIVSCLLLVSACGGDPETGLAEHDITYRIVGACVEDAATGLSWELKDERPGLHDWRNTYSWYDPQEAHGELDYRGVADGGVCSGSRCDTSDFARAVNAAYLCGFSDWRMPSRDELSSITDLRRLHNPPTSNMKYFPHTQAEEYWSGNDYSFQPDAAWAWSFHYAHDRVDWKRSAKYVRLVRGEAGKLTEVKE